MSQDDLQKISYEHECERWELEKSSIQLKLEKTSWEALYKLCKKFVFNREVSEVFQDLLEILQKIEKTEFNQACLRHEYGKKGNKPAATKSSRSASSDSKETQYFSENLSEFDRALTGRLSRSEVLQ